MAKLADKVQHAEQEAHILTIGAAALVGFGYRAVFEKGFESLPRASQYAKLGSLGLLLAAIALLFWPVAYHHVVERGDDSHRFHRFTTGVMDWALLPFAAGLGMDLYVAVAKVDGNGGAVVAGGAGLALALCFWYALAYWRRAQLGRKEAQSMPADEERAEPTPVKDKIEHVLEEVRVILPGTQALLGFQLAAMLVEGFDTLPASSKYLHLASLGLMAAAMVLLMAPAAYHRIVFQGEDAEEVHRFASQMILAAMALLAPGLAGDLFVVLRKVTDSLPLALGGALLALVVYYGCWFVFTFARRAAVPAPKPAREQPQQPHELAQAA